MQTHNAVFLISADKSSICRFKLSHCSQLDVVNHLKTVKEWEPGLSAPEIVRGWGHQRRAILKVDVCFTFPLQGKMLLLKAIMAFEFVITPETNYPKHPCL